MRAESLEPGPAFIPLSPAAQLLADKVDLFPQQSGGAIATTWLQFHDRRRHFDDSGVEINRAAGRQLERPPSSRQHFVTDQFLRGPENLLRQLALVIND